MFNDIGFVKYIIKILVAGLIYTACHSTTQKDSGNAFGTTYHLTYSHPQKIEIQDIINDVNNTFSTYDSLSMLSKINRNENIKTNSLFDSVFKVSKLVWSETNGLFDPTIGALVNHWGFGHVSKNTNVDKSSVDNILRFTGFEKVQLFDSQVEKPINTYLDFNAIAKGFAVDLLAKRLDSTQVNDYIIEVGGEIIAKGRRIASDSFWKVGIENPLTTKGKREILEVMTLKNKAVATSGNYRKFYTDSLNRKYAHIINPKTGFTESSNILSATIIANTCIEADAYATAVMNMSLIEMTSFFNRHKAIKGLIIYSNEIKSTNIKRFNY